MASTYENDLRLQEIGTGEQSGTWGVTTNTNLELIAEALSYSGTGEAVANASTHTITVANGVADEARCLYLKCTGGGQACTVTLAPSSLSKVWMVENQTSYTLTFSQGSSGANVAVLAGQVKMIATDGAGGTNGAVFDLMQDLAVPDLFVDDDLTLQSDGAVLGFGADKDVTLTHAADTSLALGGAGSTTGLIINNTATDGDPFLAFALSGTQVFTMGVDDGDSDKFKIGTTAIGTNTRLTIDSSGNTTFSGTVTATGTSVFASLDISGDIDVDGTTNLDIVDIDGAVNIATTALVTGVLTTTATQVATGGITSGSDIVSDTDSTDDLGTTGVRWANLFVDAITATDQITATGFTGTLDGILGSGTAAAATVTTLNTSDAVNLNLVTDSTSSTSGALIVDGGVGIAKKLFVGTDLDVTGNTVLDGTLTVSTSAAVDNITIDGNDISSTNTDGNLTLTANGTGDIQLRTDNVSIYAASGEAASLTLYADDNTHNGDAWEISNSTSNVLEIINTISGSLVNHVTITPNATVANSTVDLIGHVNVGHDLDVAGDAVIDGTALVTGALTTTVGATFNNGGTAVDFQVKSDDNANMLFVSGANDTVGIGTTEGNIFGTSGTANELGVQSTGTNMGAIIAVGATGTGFSGIDIGTTDLRRGGIYSLDGSVLAFYTNASNSGDGLTEALRIDASGNIIIANTGGTLYTTTAGADNFRAGENAGVALTSGSVRNVVIGDDAGTALSSGDDSVLIGADAGESLTSGTQNVAVGSGALKTGVSASNNVAVGREALSATLGSENVAVGVNTLAANQGGSHSVAIGSAALTAQNPSSGNVDFYNTAVGSQAGAAVTIGLRNTAVGANALGYEQEGVYSVAIGYNALEDQRSDASGQNVYNTAVGANAGEQLSTGIQNTLIGGNAGGDGVITGDVNVAVGYDAGKSLTAGTLNTLIGGLAGTAINTGSQNTALGYKASVSNVTSNDVTAIGYQANFFNTSAGATVVGSNAGLYSNSGANSTFIGFQAGQGIDVPRGTGDNNTAVGKDAGLLLQGTAENNTLIGATAGDNITTGDSNIIIGKGIDADSPTADNQLNIGGWIVGTAGQITMPSQPAFLVEPASNQENIAADNSVVTVVFGTETFDVGANFASNTFTAPVTGKYQLQVLLRLENVDTAAAYYTIGIRTSNRINNFIFDPDFADSDIPFYSVTFPCLMDMDEDDTAFISIQQNGGTAQTDISTASYFSGFLAC